MLVFLLVGVLPDREQPILRDVNGNLESENRKPELIYGDSHDGCRVGYYACLFVCLFVCWVFVFKWLQS